MTFLRKSGSLVAVWVKALATAARCSFCSGNRSCGLNFATTHFMPRSCVNISDTVVFGIPRSASGSHTVGRQPLLIAAPRHSTFSGVLLIAGLPEHGSLSTDSRPSLKHLCHTFICAALIALSPKAFWIVSVEKCPSLTQNLMHIHCSTLSVILNPTMATQYTCSLNSVYCPPLTSTVKSSWFTHAHSSPLSNLAARLHRCCTNHSHYINNGWTFSGQTSYTHTHKHTHICTYVSK